MSNKVVSIFIHTVATVGLLAASAARADYAYILTVGQGPGYDYNRINDAIANMPPLGPATLGCIEVYEGVYEEHLNDYYYPDGRNLPAYCDLIGEGSDKVQIRHTRGAEGHNQAAIKAEGHNAIRGLEVMNYGWNQNGVELGQDSTLEDCVVNSKHGAVSGTDGLVVSGCTIYSMYASCISISCCTSGASFEVSACTLYPRAPDPDWERGFWIETPTGISVNSPWYRFCGQIENVVISATGEGCYHNSGCGFRGIYLEGAGGGEATITNVDISLALTSVYKPGYEAPLRVCGIMLPQGNVQAVLEDCTIDVSGVEDDSNPAGDGAGIMVDGVYVRQGCSVEIYQTSITTDRTPASHGEDGYQYLLNADDGTITVNPCTCTFNPNGDDPPDQYDPDYVRGQINFVYEREFSVKNATGENVAWFDRRGNLILNGSLTQNTTPSATAADEFRVQDFYGVDVAIIDATTGNMVIKGTKNTIPPGYQWIPPCSFVVKGSDGKVVAYINSAGDLYLKGEVYQNAPGQ